jgi:uncharacterized protein YaaW (UPF0174 family)
MRAILQKASQEERQNLQTILDATTPTPDAILDALQWNSHHQAHYRLGWRKSYIDIAKQVADFVHVSHTSEDTIETIEAAIVQQMLKQAWDKLTPEQRAELESKWRQEAQKYDKYSNLAQASAAFTTLTAARLSGFGLYLGASTLVGAFTSAVGVTLPFVAYTTLSSIIAVVIGPLGWISAGIFLAWKLFDPNLNRLIPAVLYIAMLRTQQELVEADKFH